MDDKSGGDNVLCQVNPAVRTATKSWSRWRGTFGECLTTITEVGELIRGGGLTTSNGPNDITSRDLLRSFECPWNN